eukprot:jgi/Bigna1/90891/estExt_fgenesh1_pg.C_820035
MEGKKEAADSKADNNSMPASKGSIPPKQDSTPGETPQLRKSLRNKLPALKTSKEPEIPKKRLTKRNYNSNISDGSTQQKLTKAQGYPSKEPQPSVSTSFAHRLRISRDKKDNSFAVNRPSRPISAKPSFPQETDMDGLQIVPGDIEQTIYENRVDMAHVHALRASSSGHTMQHDGLRAQRPTNGNGIPNSVLSPNPDVDFNNNNNNGVPENGQVATFVESRATGGFSRSAKSRYHPSSGFQKNSSAGSRIMMNSPAAVMEREGKDYVSPATQSNVLSRKEAELRHGVRTLLKTVIFAMASASGLLAGITTCNLMSYTTQQSTETFLSFYPYMATEFSILEVSLSTALAACASSLIAKEFAEDGAWQQREQAAKARILLIFFGYFTSMICSLINVQIVERMVYEENEDSEWYKNADKRDDIALNSWVSLAVCRLILNLSCWMVSINEFGQFAKDRYRVERSDGLRIAWNANRRGDIR